MPEIAELPLLEADKLNPPLNATLITEASQLHLVTDFLSRVTVFGFDVETNMADDFSTRVVRTLQLGDRNEQYVIDLLPFAGSTEALKQQGHRSMPGWAEPVMHVLAGALCSNSHVKVGHNLQFEYECLRWGFGLRTWNFYDTMLAEKVLHAGEINFYISGYWAMDDLVARYCKKKMSKEEQKGFDLETPLRPEQVTYAALDTRVPLVLMASQEKLIHTAGLARTVRIENECIPAIGEMRGNGMLLDKEAWLEIVDSTKIEHAANVKELDKHFLPVVGSKHEPLQDLYPLHDVWRSEKDKERRKIARQAYQVASRANKAWAKDAEGWEGEAALNYGSDNQILAALHKYGFTKQELPASHDKLLRKFEKDPAIIALRKYRITQKILESYGREFPVKWVNPATGRVHADTNQLGAATGRMSARKPAMQTIPPAQRKCFVARPGYSIITTDMSGAELRILAELSNDKVWLEAFANRWDVHSIVTESMNPAVWLIEAEEGCTFATSKTKCKCKAHLQRRDASKEINFGIPFGLEAYNLADTLRITKNEAQALLDAWKISNANINSYLEGIGEKSKQTMQSRTFSGRRRLFKKPNWDACKEVARSRWADQGKDLSKFKDEGTGKLYRNAFDSIVREGRNLGSQGGCADIVKIAIALLWHSLPDFGAELVNVVHDELVVECPTDSAEACRDMVAVCIRKAGAEFMTKVTMESESHIGPRWEKE